MARALAPPTPSTLTGDVVWRLDAAEGSHHQEDVGRDIAEYLAEQGFCAIFPQPRERLRLAESHQEILRLEDTCFFDVPCAEVVDGFLGAEGSALVCDFERLAEEKVDIPPGLQAADDLLTQVSELCNPFLEECLGFTLRGRSLATLHQAGEPSEDTPKLTEEKSSRYLDMFMTSRLMAVVFLGPEPGILQLEPLHSEDSLPFEVQTEPGMVVVLRPDVLSRRHFDATGAGGAAAISCFFSQVGSPAKRSSKESLPSTVAPLMEWSGRRLEKLRAAQVKAGSFAPPPDLPRSWLHALDVCDGGEPAVRVASLSGRYPTAHDPVEFWAASLRAGTDMATSVPNERFDIADWYDPHIDSHKWHKSYCRHGVFVDGANLFDNRFFSISPVEAKGMDPTQHLLLEAGYEALYAAGFSKRKLLQAPVGVYVGQGTFEPPPMDSTEAVGGTGGARAVSCGRISFCLGMQGPCVALDVDSATAFACLEAGFHTLQHKVHSYRTGLAGSVALTFNPQMFVKMCAACWLNPAGRCCTFDQSAAGYVRGEGCGFACLRANEVVDGKEVEDDSPNLAEFRAIGIGNCGIAASMHSPTGPSEQRLVVETLRQAFVSPTSMTQAETFGDGELLADAVEVANLRRALRGDDQESCPLDLGAVMTQAGLMREVAGFGQLIRMVEGLSFSAQTPGIHLRALNPQIEDMSLESMRFPSETLPCGEPVTFSCATTRGLGGTITHAVLKGYANEGGDLPSGSGLFQRLTFWPGGGGRPEQQEPERGYFIIGSWSKWSDPERMEYEGLGTYGCTVVLGENCFEQFQIWVDADANRVLHPGQPKAPRGSPVVGPNDWVDRSSNWLIDGRTRWVPVAGPPSEGQSGDAAPLEETARLGNDRVYFVPDPSARPRSPGDRYHVRLRVAGRWRAVDWEELRDGKAAAVPGQSQYYVVGSWNDWECGEPMAPAGEGEFAQEVVLPSHDLAFFQIVRNQDWDQVFHPAVPRSVCSPDDPVLGPDDEGDGLNWVLTGTAGDRFRIVFTRKRSNGLDVCTVRRSRV